MALKIDAKFEGKLTRNLANFNRTNVLRLKV